MNPSRTHDLWAQEQAQLDRLRIERPTAFDDVGAFTPDDVLHQIGITALPSDLPLGYLRFYPEDFIVEEIDANGRLVNADFAPPSFDRTSNHQTLYAQMIKIGLDTLEAVERLTEALSVSPGDLGYAGLKDPRAVTAQWISLRGLSYEQAAAVRVPDILLTHFTVAKGKLYRGQLRGNRFTITIRTPQPPDPVVLAPQLEHLGRGMVNYYGVQRFGRRLLSHHFGRLICQGRFEQAIRDFLTATNASEKVYEAEVRRAVLDAYGQWDKVVQLLRAYPYTFIHELAVVDHLRAHPDDWPGALHAIPEQAKLWVYAYTSWLLNTTMSAYVQAAHPLPTHLPIPLSDASADIAPFKALLTQDSVPENFIDNLRPLPFIKAGERQLPTVVQPVFHGWRAVPSGLVVAFDLPTGAYATTLLSHLFGLDERIPAPAWVPIDRIDGKATLGTGTIAPLYSAAKESFDRYVTPKATV